MAANNNIRSLSTAELLAQQSQKSGVAQKPKEAANEVNKVQQEREKAMAGIATGRVRDLHQAALAIDKAEISMKLMLEVRNKALNAYKEITRTQI